MSQYGSPSLTVMGRSRSLNARAPNPIAHHMPASPVGELGTPPPFAPSSPSTTAGASSPFTSSSHSHPPSPISRFNQAGSLLSISQGGKYGHSSGNSTPLAATIIQRPLASRAAGATSFHHSLHPTAVQASHSFGQQKAALPSASRVVPVTPTSPGNLAGSSTGNKLRAKTAAYGTFPRLLQGQQRLRSAGGSPAGVSPHGRSPEPLSAHASPSMLHPRVRTGSASGKAIVMRTPPNGSAKKKLPERVRRDSEQSVDVGELGGQLQEMDITDDTGIHSGYTSDGSMESQASSFPVDGVLYADGTAVNGLPYGQDFDAELEGVSVEPIQYRNGAFPPASPLQLRAGAPHPTKMYTGVGTPVRSASGTGSVRSASRVEMSTSTEHSALQSPLLETLKVAPGSTAAALSPIPPIDSLIFPSVLPLPLASPLPHERVVFTTVPALNLPRSMASSSSSTALRSPTVAEAAAAAALALPSPNRQLSDLGSGVIVGASSAFSSARSMAHSASATSVGEEGGIMDWQSTTPTARSLSGADSLYSHSHGSNTSSMTNLHAAADSHSANTSAHTTHR